MAKSAHTEKPEPDSEGYGTDAKGTLPGEEGKTRPLQNVRSGKRTVPGSCAKQRAACSLQFVVSSLTA